MMAAPGRMALMVTQVLTRPLLALSLASLLCTAPSYGRAQEPERLEIFDAHLHYNQEPTPLYTLDQVMEIFRRNGVTGILATSRPNKGTHQLMEAKAPGFWVVPFIRPYRSRPDIQTWFNDPSIFDLVKAEYERGYYRGVGEFHIYGKSAASEWVKKIVDFAVDRNLYLHAHCDEEALLILLSHNPKAKIIWAHTGFSGKDGNLTEEWRGLFAAHSDRFLIGSDTWINERWFSYDAIMKGYRAWLAQLPRDQAVRIANDNAKRLFSKAQPTN